MACFAWLFFVLCFVLVPQTARAGLFNTRECGIFIANAELEAGIRNLLAKHPHGAERDRATVELWLTREKLAYWLVDVAQKRRDNFVLISKLRNAMNDATPALRQFAETDTYPSPESMTLILKLASLDAQLAEGRMLGFRALRRAMENDLAPPLEQAPETVKQQAAQAAQERLKEAIELDSRAALPVRFEFSAPTLNQKNLQYHAPNDRTNILRNLRDAVAELKSSAPRFLIEEAELEIEFLENYGFANVAVLQEFLTTIGQLRGALIALSGEKP